MLETVAPGADFFRTARIAERIEDGGSPWSRIDLHLHSRASGAATNWWVKGLGLGVETRESYTAPDDAYRLARQAGMDFVTLTDHETIDGALTLVGRPDFLTGVEVAARFPEDGTAIDVLVYGLTPDEHQEIQSRRDDVYRLVAFLREAKLVHVLAHPIFEIGAPLDRAMIEKRLVLFGLWETINGSRPAEQNRLARDLAAAVDAVDLRRLAVLHDLPVPPHRFVAGVGGSDDHGGIYPGQTCTVVPRVGSVPDLLAALAAGEVWAEGEDGSVDKMVHTGLKIAGAAVSEGGMPGAAGDGAPSLVDYLPLLSACSGSQIRRALAGRYEARLAETLGKIVDAPALSFFGAVGSFVDAHLFLAPYLGIHAYFGRERGKAQRLRAALDLRERRPLRIGVFVDNLDEVHGVGTMYRNLERLGHRRDDLRLSFARCGTGERGEAPAVPAVATLPIPLYPGRSLPVPSLLDLLDLVAGSGLDLLHVATPGPLGLEALVAGSILGLPVVGAYHTEFGRYAEALSGDAMLAELVDAVVREFYARCAVVTAPSDATVRSLRARGYGGGRMATLRNGVDTDLFRPDRRDPRRHAALGGGRTLLLYCGRISREKGLDALVAGYRALRARRDDVHLVLVGDGPDRARLAAELGERATLTGFLHGEALAATVASCDLFLFPSLTDTLGRAVAEAQASGLPAVVFGVGGPRECVLPSESGLVADPGDLDAFFALAESLLDDPARRAAMGRRARAFAETLTWERVLDDLAALYRDVAGAAAAPVEAIPGIPVFA